MQTAGSSAPAGRATGAVPATVRARERATLTARVPGSVMALPFREGDAVSAGAVVARIEDRALRAALTAAEADRDAAEADRARSATLLSRGAATPREAEQANAGGGGAARAGGEGGRGYAELRAPFAGRVAARPANVGDVVMPGTPLVEIDGEGGLEVVATVDEDAVARLSPGAHVAVDVDGQSSPIEATIRAVAPSGDAVTHRAQVRADLPATTGVRSGMFARLRIAPRRAARPPRASSFPRARSCGGEGWPVSSW